MAWRRWTSSPGEVRVVKRDHLRAVAPPPVKFFHFVPAKSSEAKPSLRSSFMSGRLYCLASATSASAISVFVLQTTLPVLPAITRQPGFLRKTLSRSSGPLSGAALLLDTCSLLQPAQFFVKKRSSEKSEVLVTVSVLEAKSCGAETVPELVTSPQTTLPVDTPPLVAVKVQSRLFQWARGGRPADSPRWLRSSPRLLRPRPSMSPCTRRPPW